MGSDGIFGIPATFRRGTRFAAAVEAYPGVPGSPGPSLRNCTEPRWIADGGRIGPSG